MDELSDGRAPRAAVNCEEDSCVNPLFMGPTDHVSNLGGSLASCSCRHVWAPEACVWKSDKTGGTSSAK
eukprot:4060661-Pyramimonas_sp.AAC.1